MQSLRGRIISVGERLKFFFSNKKNSVVVALVLLIVILLIVFFLPPLKQQSKPIISMPLPKEYIQMTLPYQARAYINDFNSSYIQKQYAITSAQVSAVKNDKGIVINPNKYTTFWKLSDGTLAQEEITFQDVSVMESFAAYFIPEEKIISLTPNSAQTTVNTYFTIEPETQWVCEEVVVDKTTKEKATMCENFWTDTRGIKKGLGILNTNTSYIFYCEIYPTAKNYSWESCTPYGNK